MELPEPDREAAVELWEGYLASEPELHGSRGLPPVEFFGDSPPLADALLQLVLAGTKRATATLAIEFSLDGEPLPRVGDHWIACDGTGRPRAVLRSVELRLGGFHSVDAGFAFDEGEDDRTLESWRREHRRYWQRVAAARGFQWSEEQEILFERFSVVWPPR